MNGFLVMPALTLIFQGEEGGQECSSGFEILKRSTLLEFGCHRSIPRLIRKSRPDLAQHYDCIYGFEITHIKATCLETC